MKRSEVNRIILEADGFIRARGYVLPPFAHYTPEELRRRSDTPIFRNRLGWDITDFGKGDFDNVGLFLFTARNGDAANLGTGRGMVYAEKIMISRDGQRCPMHRHETKVEDIINRGGGDLVLKLHMADGNGDIDHDREVSVPVDAEEFRMPSGGLLRLKPGQSVTLHPDVWHAFWAEGGDVLIVEVSTVNDDLTDNVFAEPVGRFSEIEEDEAPLHLLVSDY